MSAGAAPERSLLSRFFLFVIRIYWMTLSPIIGGVCRFQPTCSRYTAACIERFGGVRGGWLGFKRICRCHPFHPGGWDPPPELPGLDGHERLSAGGDARG